MYFKTGDMVIFNSERARIAGRENNYRVWAKNFKVDLTLPIKVRNSTETSFYEDTKLFLADLSGNSQGLYRDMASLDIDLFDLYPQKEINLTDYL